MQADDTDTDPADRDPDMNFLGRQLRFRDHRFGLVAAVAAPVDLFLVLLSPAFILYHRANPDPEAVGATFEALPGIVLTAPPLRPLHPW